MKSQLSLLLFFVSFAIFSSCTKTVTITNTITKTDTLTQFVTNNSILNLLTSKQWIPDSVYTNYTGPNTGTLVYVRGANNNTKNLDADRFTFWPDGSQDWFINGAYYSYSWSFVSTTDSTKLLINNTAADYARILTLTSNYLTLYDSTNSGLAHYAFKP
ncbi:MAG TPA: hypothetical protein VIJ75_17085 [Hanamia sp.]